MPVFSTISKQFDIRDLKISKNNLRENELGFVLGLFGASWGLQRKLILVLGLGDTSGNPEIMNMRVFGFPRSKSKSD